MKRRKRSKGKEEETYMYFIFLCDVRYLVFHSMLCVYLSFGCGHWTFPCMVVCACIQCFQLKEWIFWNFCIDPHYSHLTYTYLFFIIPIMFAVVNKTGLSLTASCCIDSHRSTSSSKRSRNRSELLAGITNLEPSLSKRSSFWRSLILPRLPAFGILTTSGRCSWSPTGCAAPDGS